MSTNSIKGFKSPSILREGFRMGYLDCLKMNLIIVFLFQMSTIICQNNNINDYQALRAIYLSTNGDDWKFKNGWPSSAEFKLNVLPPPNTDYSKWYGVYCGDGRVFGLWFKENNLTGVLPKEIGNLSELSDVKIYGNPIGGKIPSSIGKLKKLKIINLYDNKFSGKIPKELCKLNSLKQIDLRRNEFRGKIPKELGDLKSLKFLDLAENKLKSKIPVELGQLKFLESIRFESNNLLGDIPSTLGNLSELTSLYLSNNNLSGDIPQELFQLKKLKYFDFEGNKLNEGSLERFKDVKGDGY